ncbi:hypothetical protein GGI17_002294 [Coemansia sp. S146]|nr:hypothetical protein GGI17_002294 [Coemansia sp. S146]
MPHIDTLPVAVLAQILFKAAATPAKNLFQWKAKLPLLAVCRTWTKLAIDFVFCQVYVEVAASRGSYSKARPLWTSNAELLISRGCVLAARRLKIEWLPQTTPDHLRLVVLELLKLDCVDWQRIYSLTFTSSIWGLYSSVKPDDLIVADIVRTIQYFAQNLRNIVELDMSYLNQGSTGKYLYSNLVTFYCQQLQILRATGPVPFPISCFLRNIKVLVLTLDSSAACILPSICGKTLKVLKLDNVPHNFAWRHFRYDLFVRPIVFRRLTILRLTFKYKDVDITEDEIQDKIASGAHNCDQLSFPALRQLYIHDCTPDCDLLYADLPFPELKYVHLTGSINSIRHCSRLKLSWVGSLEVSVSIPKTYDTKDYYRATSHFFADIGISRTATLNIVGGQFALDTDLMRWVNLTNLQVGDVDYDAVCKAIGRLPNLCKLTVSRLKCSSVVTDTFSADSSLYISADPKLAWGEKLIAVTITKFYQDSPIAVCVDSIQALILHAGALNRLYVPEPAKQLMVKFIDMYMDRHRHLANMIILSSAAATPAKRLSEWKTKLPLLAVCRTWTKLAIYIVFDQVYVEVAASRRSALKARPLWTSNAELFISRGCILAAKRLTVEWVNYATPNHLHYIVLDVLQLDCVDW